MKELETQVTIPKRFKELVNKLYKSNKNFKEYKKKYETEKEEYTLEVLKFLEELETDSISFDVETRADRKIVTVNKRISNTIVYDVSKIESKVDKETCTEFIDKQYIIIDYDGLVKYLRTCGVDANKFKNYVRVEKSVNKYKLEQLFQLGYISIKQLKGCYTLKQSKPYIDVKITGKN